MDTQRNHAQEQAKAHLQSIMAMVKELTVEDVGLGKEFPLHLVAKISANNSIDVDFTLDTLLTLDYPGSRVLLTTYKPRHRDEA